MVRLAALDAVFVARQDVLEDRAFGPVHRLAVRREHVTGDFEGVPVLEDAVPGALVQEPGSRDDRECEHRDTAEVQGPLLHVPDDAVEAGHRRLAELHGGRLSQEIGHVHVGIRAEHLDSHLRGRVQRIGQSVSTHLREERRGERHCHVQEQGHFRRHTRPLLHRPCAGTAPPALSSALACGTGQES